jgi:hypothetical protein
MRLLPSLCVASLLTGCAPTEGFDVTMQQARAARVGVSGFLALDLLATDGADPIPCDDGSFEVAISVTAEGPDGHFTQLPPQSWEVACNDGRTGDLSLVIDNSGSEAGFLDWLKQAAGNMADELLGRGGRLGVVRVSTNAELVQPLTSSAEAIDAALDDLFISNGWTALWDGVRLGHESLQTGAAAGGDRTAIQEFCFGDNPLGVAAFTDGVDNNSADEFAADYDAARYPGDGVDTELADLFGLRIGDATTPIYTLGLGAGVDDASLSQLAQVTGARYRPIASAEEIPETFDILQSYFDATHEVCVELPDLECGELVVRVDWTWTPEGGDPVTGSVEQGVNYACAEQPTQGRIATILLTMGDPGFPDDFASTIARQAVEWTSPRLRPNVLVVLDDNHNGEDLADHDLVEWLLDDIDTLDVAFLDEPGDGLTLADLQGYDVVWFANPGYPVDDADTATALQDFVALGGGLVLQGDDMTRARGGAFEMSPLTGLDHVDNGTRACGRQIDNRRHETYTVTITDADHALTRGLTGQSFTYGNDIDDSDIANPEVEILATAVPTNDPDCPSRPVIIGWTP